MAAVVAAVAAVRVAAADWHAAVLVAAAVVAVVGPARVAH